MKVYLKINLDVGVIAEFDDDQPVDEQMREKIESALGFNNAINVTGFEFVEEDIDQDRIDEIGDKAMIVSDI